MTTMTIRIPDKLKKTVNKICKEENIKASDLIREGVLKIVALHQFQLLRKSIMPKAEKAGYLTDEDVFKNIS